MNTISKKIIKYVHDDFIVINNTNLELQETISVIRNFGEFSKLILLLNQRQKEAENV